MDASELRQLAKVCLRKEYPKGTVILKQGAPADKLVFLTQGECSVTRSNSEAKNPLSPTNFQVLSVDNIEKEGVERLAVIGALAVLGDVDIFAGPKAGYGVPGYKGRENYTVNVRAHTACVGLEFKAATLVELGMCVSAAMEQLKETADLREEQWSKKRMDVRQLLHRMERADTNVGACAKLVHVKCLGRMAQAHKAIKVKEKEVEENFQNEVKRLCVDEGEGGEGTKEKDVAQKVAAPPKLFEEEVVVVEFVDPYQSPQLRDELMKDAALKFSNDNKMWVKQALSPNSKNNKGASAYFNPFEAFEPTQNTYSLKQPEVVVVEEVVEEVVEVAEEKIDAGFSDSGSDSDDESEAGFGTRSPRSDASEEEEEEEGKEGGEGEEEGGEGEGASGTDSGSGGGTGGATNLATPNSPATPTPISSNGRSMRPDSSISTTSTTMSTMSTASTVAEDAARDAAWRLGLSGVMEEDIEVAKGRTVKRGKAVDVIRNFDRAWQSRPKPAALLALQQKRQEQISSFIRAEHAGHSGKEGGRPKSMRPELPEIVTTYASSVGTEVPSMLACEDDVVLRNHASRFAREKLSKNYDSATAGPALDPARLEQINGIGRVVRQNPFCAFGAPTAPEIRRIGYFPPEKKKKKKKKAGYRLA
jgi:CRP-like cAMP-binding protein